MNFRLVLIALSLVVTPVKAESPAADALTRQALLVMQLVARQVASEGGLSKTALKCVQAVPSSEFYQATEQLINLALTQPERTVADSFFATTVGQKYLTYGLSQLSSSAGGQPVPPPQFSDAENRELAQFAGTSAGQKFKTDQVMHSVYAEQKYGSRMRELLARCQIK